MSMMPIIRMVVTMTKIAKSIEGMTKMIFTSTRWIVSLGFFKTY